MPDHSSAEENIDRLLIHFQQQGQYKTIQEWRQQIENEDARLAHRVPQLINVDRAVQDFRRFLFSDTAHSESAKHVLRELNRPKHPKFTSVEAWRIQIPSNRPDVLTPEQQAYVQQYDQQQRDRAKWDMPIPENRLRKWYELDAQGSQKAVWADQVKLLEEWLEQHPDRVEELATRFAMPGAPPNESDLPESYHWSGLYWLAANVVFRRFGFGDQIRQEVGGAVFDRLYGLFQGRDNRPFNKLPENRRDELNAAFGQAMVEAHRKLARIGAEEIQYLERWLAHSAKIILAGGRAVDPETRKRQRRKRKTQSAENDDRQIPGKEPDISIADWIEWSEHFDPSQQETEEHDSLQSHPKNKEEASNVDTLSTAELSEFVASLTDQQKAILGPLFIDPYLSNGELAKRFNLTPQRIGQIRKEIEKLWESL